ncbi:transmembrane protein 70, mitochondrial [Nerophis lumbriciformis]|uniref:transmembrane protein 70, mitochondrial n=1 Tax=Nerophis lumbriciformis TaxID=546530 RepID=UPI002ADF2B69|nr:transmembrane protein 70, mitochondrial-like [Nerophis lumbriciformis]
MFTVRSLCKARLCSIPKLLSRTHESPSLASFCSGLTGSPLHAARRTPLILQHTLSHTPWTASLCTAPRSDPGDLIYSGTLGAAVRGVKMFSYSTSGASLFLMPQILLKTGLGVQSLAVQAAFCGIMGFFTFLTPVLLHLITKGYVVRLYHNPDMDTYTAVTYSVVLTERRTVFRQDQVRVPAISKMFTTFCAGNTGLLVNPDLFAAPQDYNHLMGYDKPFTFPPDHPDDQ